MYNKYDELISLLNSKLLNCIGIKYKKNHLEIENILNEKMGISSASSKWYMKIK